MEEDELPSSSTENANQSENMDMTNRYIPYDPSSSISESRIEIIPAETALTNFLGHFEILNRKLACKFENIGRLQDDIATNQFENEGDLREQQEKLSILRMEYDRENREATKLLNELKNRIGEQLIGIDLYARMNALTMQLNEKSGGYQKVEEQLDELKRILIKGLGNMKIENDEENQVIINSKNEEILRCRNEYDAIRADMDREVQMLRCQLTEKTNQVHSLNTAVGNSNSIIEESNIRNGELLRELEEYKKNIGLSYDLSRVIEELKISLKNSEDEIQRLNLKMLSMKTEHDIDNSKHIQIMKEMDENLRRDLGAKNEIIEKQNTELKIIRKQLTTFETLIATEKQNEIEIVNKTGTFKEIWRKLVESGNDKKVMDGEA